MAQHGRGGAVSGRGRVLPWLPASEIPVFIISHRTRHPFIGEPHDLHAAALSWLERQGFFTEDQIRLPRIRCFSS